jgi:hypothetical protein
LNTEKTHATVPLKMLGRVLKKKYFFTGVDGRNVGDGLNRWTRRVCIYTPNGPIGGRGCTEQANKKQVAMENFRSLGWHKFLFKK